MADIIKQITLIEKNDSGPYYDIYWSNDCLDYTLAVDGNNVYLPSAGATANVTIPDTTQCIRLVSVGQCINSVTSGSAPEFQFLLVAGGGAGNLDRSGAGGGAGGVLMGTTPFSLGSSFNISVGQGGLNDISFYYTGSEFYDAGYMGYNNSSGSDSQFNGNIAIGGGHGGIFKATPAPSQFMMFDGSSGGSGGGSATDYREGTGVQFFRGGSGTTGQGTSGGAGYNGTTAELPGGGGGSSTSGQSGTATTTATNGGDGKLWIDGLRYGGGGAGIRMEYDGIPADYWGDGGLGGGGDESTGFSGSNGFGGGGAAHPNGYGGDGVFKVSYPGIAQRIVGGVITQDVDTVYHTFNYSSMLYIPSSSDELNYKILDYLIVAGGGGGGQSSLGGPQGGGGAGGFITGSLILSASLSESVIVGNGGAPNQNGETSSFYNLTAIGGGYGGYNTTNAGNGGSGGGSGQKAGNLPGTGSQGNDGADGGTVSPKNYGGGGGGASQKVIDVTAFTSNTVTNKGGNGLKWADGNYYAGGGGGAISIINGTSTEGGSGGIGGGGIGASQSTSATNGTANTGGGGGGGYDSTFVAGNGGSGIVIIRYVGTPIGTGGTITQSGGYTYHYFTSNGTLSLLL